MKLPLQCNRLVLIPFLLLLLGEQQNALVHAALPSQQRSSLRSKWSSSTSLNRQSETDGNSNSSSSFPSSTLWRQEPQRHHRKEQALNQHTLTTTELGLPNPDAAIGNPLKGLMPSPSYSQPPYTPNLPHSLEFYYIGLKTVMIGNPATLGAAAYDWSAVETILSGTVSRSVHAVLRFWTVYPGRPMSVPQYLIDAGIELRNYTDDNVTQVSPFFGDPILLQGLEQFVHEFARKYDGDKRIGFFQAGLLGFYGEWHSNGRGLLPDSVRLLAVDWYVRAFNKTQVQFRYPSAPIAAAGPGFGLHDDSFGYETLDGPYNGGLERSFYFWRRVMANGMTNSWRYAATGGETRPELQGEIFESTYNASTPNKQDFFSCVNVTRATYMFHHGTFQSPYIFGTERINAQRATARMGYNFHVPLVSVRNSTADGQVDVSVTVTQIGVAPFYYDLGLGLACSGMTKRILSGVDTLIDSGESRTFVFTGIPSAPTCLRAITLSLESSYAFAGRPIKFAQGNSGTVVFRVPLPDGGTHAPTLPPTLAPTKAPLSYAPTFGPLLATNLTLINADTDLDIVRMTNGMIINSFLYPNLNVRANPSSSVGSVQFKLNDAFHRNDNAAPFSFAGNSGQNYFAWTPLPGIHTIEATPFSSSGGTGTPGPSRIIRFEVVYQPPTTAPTKAPHTKSPTKAPATNMPTKTPSKAPVTKSPTLAPTKAPATKMPTKTPSKGPVTKAPTLAPTKAPVTKMPTKAPSKGPVTKSPTLAPAKVPFAKMPTKTPSNVPVTKSPTLAPTKAPVTKTPTKTPSTAPITKSPTLAPAKAPVIKMPTEAPSNVPVTKSPTRLPTTSPATKLPTLTPSKVLTKKPTKAPTKSPTTSPTKTPIKAPTKVPTKAPKAPTMAPKAPTMAPAKVPTKAPVWPSVSQPTIVDLVLYNADTDVRIMSLVNNTVVSRSTQRTNNFSVEAILVLATSGSPPVSSVRFGVNSNAQFRTDSQAPYSINGNTGRDFAPWTPSLGTYTITATPQSNNNPTGRARRVTFTIVA